MKNKNSPIAIFDSGIGGLTVLREVQKSLPYENYIYYGDGKSCPIGNLPHSEIMSITINAINILVERGAKMIIIACNTATAVAIKKIRELYSIPIVAIEPAVKPALNSSKSGVIGVLATQRTIDGKPLKELCARLVTDQKVVFVAGNGLVEIVEGDGVLSASNYSLIEGYIEEMISQGADQIVLGCTHYPFLIKTMQEIIGSRNVTIINPAPSIAVQVEKLLATDALLNKNGGKIEFCSSLDKRYNDFIEKNYYKLLSL